MSFDSSGLKIEILPGSHDPRNPTTETADRKSLELSIDRERNFTTVEIDRDSDRGRILLRLHALRPGFIRINIE